MTIEAQTVPTRQTLLSRLKNFGDDDSWNDFFNTYWKLIYSAAIKSGLSEAEAQDVVQETVISVSKKIGKFRYDPKQGSFKSWLLQLTRWRIADQFRKRLAGIGGANGRAVFEEQPIETLNIVDPYWATVEEVWEREWDQNLMDAALERVKAKIDPFQFQIFDLLVFQRWAPRRIAASLNVTAPRVYLIKHRVSKAIRREVKYLQRNMF